MQLPASVTPIFRIPLFWLSFHNFPLWYYKHIFNKAYRKDGYVNIYFHPWEFYDLNDKQRFGFPGYVSRNTGLKMKDRLDQLMAWINRNQYPTSTIASFLESVD